jgi:hypothetical protein
LQNYIGLTGTLNFDSGLDPIWAMGSRSDGWERAGQLGWRRWVAGGTACSSGRWRDRQSYAVTHFRLGFARAKCGEGERDGERSGEVDKVVWRLETSARRRHTTPLLRRAIATTERHEGEGERPMAILASTPSFYGAGLSREGGVQHRKLEGRRQRDHTKARVCRVKGSGG